METCCWYSRDAEMSFGRNTNNPVYVIFVGCDKRTSVNKHKKQSQNGMQYKADKPKTILLDKATYKQWMRKDFL